MNEDEKTRRSQITNAKALVDIHLIERKTILHICLWTAKQKPRKSIFATMEK